MNIPVQDLAASKITGKTISKLMVCRTAADYCIGRMQKFQDCVWMPYSRDSDYYLVKPHAEDALRLQNKSILAALGVTQIVWPSKPFVPLYGAATSSRR